MKEGYKEGDVCIYCGRNIKKFKCIVCDGSGKPQNPGWAKIRNTCPACEGAGHNFFCPVGKLVSLGEHFDGKTCATVDWADKI